MTARIRIPCRISEKLEHAHMSAAEREAARAYLRQGAIVAEMVIGALAHLRSFRVHVGRRLRGLLRFTH